MVRDSVRAFYDAFAWKKDERSARYLGEILHEDLAVASQQYMHANEARYRKHFGGGRFFLDAGSGSEPRREMSRHCSKHVCVDISLVGLREARQQLREAGLYVVADLAALPFPESCFDGVLASHCLYHIEKDLQPVVLWEFFRVVKPKRNIVAFYHSPHSLPGLLGRLVKALRGARRRAPAQAAPPLYFYGHPPRRLAEEFPAAEVTCLRILKRAETQILKRLRLLRPAIAACEFLERSFPHAMVSVGEYAAIRIPKRRGGNLFEP